MMILRDIGSLRVCELQCQLVEAGRRKVQTSGGIRFGKRRGRALAHRQPGAKLQQTMLFEGGSELIWPQGRMIARPRIFIRLRLNLHTPDGD
ncbi:MAG TPA: hypothetical protein VGB93_02705 [Methylovirgula sp.]